MVDTEPMPTVVVSNGLVRVESESRRAEQVALVIFNSISNLNTLTSLYMTWTDDVILMSHWSTSPPNSDWISANQGVRSTDSLNTDQ